MRFYAVYPPVLLTDPRYQWLRTYDTLLVAPVALASAPSTVDAFSVSRRRCAVIVDNGAPENDGVPSIVDALRVAAHVYPDVIVCPDYMGDSERTLGALVDYVGACASVAQCVMVVPHGRNIAEWCMCAEQAINLATKRLGDVRVVVGVPKYLERLGARRAAVAWLSRNWDLTRTHLLGTWQSLTEIAVIADEFPTVASFDTSLPTALAYRKRRLTSLDAPKASLDESDWTRVPSEDEVAECLQQNLDYIRTHL